ncbi:hypothetical protein ACFQ05_32870 [Amycolatopsis umgeniensis]|uniref:Lipoprotein n=1 Tax=Amycolatopsis umgeniensis TaxID=336628 RepID=A0A841AP77_9PSEU|nr:hypothetical protein [Amycolatopsis umgeniensis]MBB5850579.1 hypothetical protein [Amycolatopsis umgeniensis]
MTSHPATRLRVTVALTACCLLAGCGPSSPAPAPAPPPAPTPTGPAPALVSWTGGYCGAVKDMRLIVYGLAKGYDIKTDADVPKAEASLKKLDTALAAAIGGLGKLPQIAKEADALASGELAFYRKLRGQVTEYLALLPKGGAGYAKAALDVTGIDLVSHVPAVESDKVPGLDQAMKANKACELVG